MRPEAGKKFCGNFFDVASGRYMAIPGMGETPNQA